MADEIDSVADSTEQATEGGREQAASATPEPQPSAGGDGGANDALQNNLLKTAAESGGNDGVKPEDGEQTGEEKGQPEGAPESYVDFKEPEGVKFDDQVIGTFKEVAKELNLSQEKAQGVLDKMGPILAQRQIENIQAVSKQWEERSRADKELSADWNRSMAAIARVRDKFSRGPDGTVDADIEEFLRLPIGNHPGCLKLLARAGHAIGEAGFPRGSAAGDGKVTPEAFYKSAQK